VFRGFISFYENQKSINPHSCSLEKEQKKEKALNEKKN
jgi:hypothetical protein